MQVVIIKIGVIVYRKCAGIHCDIAERQRSVFFFFVFFYLFFFFFVCVCVCVCFFFFFFFYRPRIIPFNSLLCKTLEPQQRKYNGIRLGIR